MIMSGGFQSAVSNNCGRALAFGTSFFTSRTRLCGGGPAIGPVRLAGAFRAGLRIHDMRVVLRAYQLNRPGASNRAVRYPHQIGHGLCSACTSNPSRVISPKHGREAALVTSGVTSKRMLHTFVPRIPARIDKLFRPNTLTTESRSTRRSSSPHPSGHCRRWMPCAARSLVLVYQARAF